MTITREDRATLKRWNEMKKDISKTPESKRLEETARILHKFTPDELFMLAATVSENHSK